MATGGLLGTTGGLQGAAGNYWEAAGGLQGAAEGAAGGRCLEMLGAPGSYWDVGVLVAAGGLLGNTGRLQGGCWEVPGGYRVLLGAAEWAAGGCWELLGAAGNYLEGARSYWGVLIYDLIDTHSPLCLLPFED